ncbi:MAG: DUF1801 domain-containing protein [Chitinophagaceae bacterium]|nr:DUF1801 domain-containing protein [Bacteroidota bacterium]MCC6257320.1 DUF1801 domain-containing protein [Chitinophagaceae bacterium]MCW5916732.1 DUF1801 domain-containing protein [Ferruginibacter sp.]
MGEIKTKQTSANVLNFINEFADTEQKKADSLTLLKLMEKVSGCEPKMWGPSIIGFGRYHYKSDRSSQEGDWPLIGFSPRKNAISLYVYNGSDEHAYLLRDLGKYKMGKACIYIKRLADINQENLVTLMKETIKFLHGKYGNPN